MLVPQKGGEPYFKKKKLLKARFRWAEQRDHEKRCRQDNKMLADIMSGRESGFLRMYHILRRSGSEGERGNVEREHNQEV